MNECVASLNSDLVLSDVVSPPTQHAYLSPRFHTNRLPGKMELLSAGKYHTMAEKSYHVIDSEERLVQGQ